MQKQIVVLYNLPGTSTTQNIAEADEDTRDSAIVINNQLNKNGYKSQTLGITANDIKNLSNLKTDLVFNLVEWSGKESELGIEVIETLEKANIKYTGSNAQGYKLSCDKTLMKQQMCKFNIPTPSDKKFPLILKPSMEHCGIGVSQKSVVTNDDELRIMNHELREKYKQPIIIEEFIDGDEAHVTILEKNGKPWVLAPAIFRFEKKANYWPVMSYEAKWDDKHWESDMSYWVDDYDKEVVENIKDIAYKCCVNLGGRSYSRVDMRIRGREVFVLEINNNPGIGWDDNLGITYSAKKAGFKNYGQLLKHIVENNA